MKRKISLQSSLLLIASTFGITVFIFIFALHQFEQTKINAADFTWDGGGTTNNWSEGANWVGDSAPGTGDVAIFDGTSTKDVTIDTSVTVSGITIASGYTGTISGGTGTIDVNGPFSQADGTFTSTTGELQLGGALTFTGGTFNPSTGTVIADTANTSWDVNSSATFYNFTVDLGAGATLTIASGDTIVVSEALILRNGVLNTGTIELQKNATQESTFDGGSAVIEFGNDGLAQTYTIQGGEGPTIELDSSADASDQIDFDAAATLRGVTITSGFSGTIPISNPSDFEPTITNWSQAAGTIDLSAQTSWLFNDFDVTGGSFTAPQTVTAVFGNGTWDVQTTQTFENLVINKTFGGTLTINSGETLIVTEQLTLQDGNVNTGTIDARKDIVQNSTFDGGTGVIEFGDDGLAQTYTIQGGSSPVIELDSAADANDVIDFDAAATIRELRITSGFSGAIPITNPSDFVPIFTWWNQAAGTYDASAQTEWILIDFDRSGGSFTAPVTVTADGSNATWDVPTSQIFENLTLSKNFGGTLTIPSGDTLIVTEALILDDGRVNTGTIEARKNITQNATFDGGSGVIDFGDDGLAQTFSINGGVTPTIQLDSAADANDDIDYNTASAVINLINVTSGFSGVIPFNNPSDFTVDFERWNQEAGTYDASAQTQWNIEEFDISGGTFTAPALVLSDGLTNTWDIVTTQTFQNFTVNRNFGGGMHIHTGTVIVTGDLNLTDGSHGTISNGTLEARGDVTVASTWDGGTGILQFGGTSNQTFDLTGATNLLNEHIIVDKNGGIVSLLSDLIMDYTSQDLTIVEGTFHLNGYDLTMSAPSFQDIVIQDGGVFSWQGDETLTFNVSDPVFNSGSFVRYTGDGDASADTYTITDDFTDNIEGLIINSTDGATDTFDLGAALDLSTDFTLTAGTFETNGYQMNVAGDWSNTGTFSAESNTVILDGTGQSINGSTTFSTLTKSVASADTLTFEAGETQAMTGTLTLEGASGELLSIRSNPDGNTTSINPSGTIVVSYLDVKDNSNINGGNITCTTGCVDSTNNNGWDFGGGGGGGGDSNITADVSNEAPQLLTGTVKLCDNSGSIANTDVAISGCSDLTSVNLVAGSTLSVSLFATVRDNNGESDIASSGHTAAYYHSTNASPASESCTGDNNNCYQLSGSKAVAINSTDAWIRFDFDLEYYTDDSVGAAVWTGYAQTQDNSAVTDDNSGSEYTNEVASLVSVSFPDVAYGSLTLPFTSTSANNIEINHQNNGNVLADIDVSLDGGEMTCSGTGSISASSIHFDITDEDFATLSKTMTATPTTTNINIDVAQRTNDTAAQLGTDIKTSYWGISVISGVSGSCSGTLSATVYEGP